MALKKLTQIVGGQVQLLRHILKGDPSPVVDLHVPDRLLHQKIPDTIPIRQVVRRCVPLDLSFLFPLLPGGFQFLFNSFQDCDQFPWIGGL